MFTEHQGFTTPFLVFASVRENRRTQYKELRVHLVCGHIAEPQTKFSIRDSGGKCALEFEGPNTPDYSSSLIRQSLVMKEEHRVPNHLPTEASSKPAQ